MRVLFDLNVLIDVACRWQIHPASFDLYNAIVVSPSDTGVVPACGYTTLYYVIGQLLSEDRTRAVLDRFRQQLEVAVFAETTAAAAHRLQMRDLEDACVAATAFEARCDVIATRNLDDFLTSPIPARTPEELLHRLDE